MKQVFTSEADSRLELSFENALRGCIRSAAFFVDPSGQIVGSVGEGASLLGLGDSVRFPCALHCVPPELQRLAQAALGMGKPAGPEEFECQSGGHSLFLRGCAAPTHQHASGSAVVVLATVASLSELSEKLQHLSRLAKVGALSAGVAHELRNALVAVRTFFDLLAEAKHTPDLVSLASGEIQRIDSVVGSLLKLAGPSHHEKAPVDIHALLGRALSLLRGRLGATGVVLKQELVAKSCVVAGNEARLHEAFLNIALNALEAMPQGGMLTVITEARGGELAVTIQDSGVGMSPESFGHLFEPFFTTKRTGTGLGLHITHQIIREHHGRICVESEPGQGTSFEVSLPLV